MENENNEIEPVSITSEDIQELHAQARASMQGHNWIQYGTEVVCDTCPFRHSFYLAPGNILKGIDEDGKPIIDKISILS